MEYPKYVIILLYIIYKFVWQKCFPGQDHANTLQKKIQSLIFCH